MSLATLTEFLELSLLINIVMLMLSAVMIYGFRGFMLRTHQALFNLSEAELTKLYFTFLAHYKLLVLVFNFTPYIVLKFLM